MNFYTHFVLNGMIFSLIQCISTLPVTRIKGVPGFSSCKYQIRHFSSKKYMYEKSGSTNNSSGGYTKDAFKYPRLYMSKKLSVKTEFLLDCDDAHYVSTVMRMKTGQFIRVFNGLDGEFVGEVHVHKKSKTKSVNIVICQHLRSADTVQNLPCVLLFAPLRRSRMKILLEKATELGIQYMIPVHTQNTQHYLDAASIDQYRKTLVQSVEQSERFFIPTLCNAVGVASVGRDAHTGTIKSNTGKDDGIQVMSQLKSILVCTERINPTAGTATSDAAAATVSATPILESLLDVMDGYGYAPPHTRVPDIALFVGPEGGFTEDEIHSLAQEDKATMVTLGRSILRAETAIISALGVVSAVFEMKSNVKYD
mmetsp:Transcript_15452/g.25847  ORF Transcript_15452/g.25847 Transcript_15452/m.25847 type:complete len:367 (-) Transcript_15452:617-1717(-)